MPRSAIRFALATTTALQFAACSCRAPETIDDLNARQADGSTALMRAALVGCAADVQVLLDRGADPNVADDTGATALMWAAYDLDKTRLLLDHGANVNAETQSSMTPLMVAASGGDSFEIVQLLLAHGADVSHSMNGFTACGAAAAESEDPRVVRLLHR
jgi:ankyrin repeat protein